MSNATEPLTKPARTAELIDRLQAAKRYRIDFWAVYDALKAGKLTALATGKRGEQLVADIQVRAWLDSLTPEAQPTVFACTRKGCSCCVDRTSHHPATIIDGVPQHGLLVEDNRCMPNGRLRPDDLQRPHWNVYLVALGDGPWEVEVKVCTPEVFPAKSEDRLFAEYDVPDSNELAEAMVRAVAKRDKLNGADK